MSRKPQRVIEIASDITGRKIGYTVLPQFVFTAGSRFNPELNEVRELLPRYCGDNVFDTTKFNHRFPDFQITTYRDGITEILAN